MLYYIKKYPVSIIIILTVIYLSFFKPPSTELSKIPNIDKIVHLCMYFGMSGMLWLEFLRTHRKVPAPMWHAWIGAFFCPVLFSGCVVPLIVVEIGWILLRMLQGRSWQVWWLIM